VQCDAPRSLPEGSGTVASMRVLVSSTGGAGHFGPLVPFLEALARMGDEVLLVVPPKLEATVAPMGHAFVLGAEPPAEEVRALWGRMPMVSRSEAAILSNREFFGRLCTTAMLPSVERACHEWGPHLVLHEAAEYASAVAAERSGIAHAQVAISLAEVEAASLDLAAPVLETFHEGIVERLRGSPYLTRFPDPLDPSPYPATRRFRELAAAPGKPLPDWWGSCTAPLVYLTFGSVVGELPMASDVFRAAVDAVTGLAARVLLTVGRAADVALSGAPANVHIEAWVPQGDVLPGADVVVAHGGSGTTFGALAAGVPLVLVPLFADQLVNAARVAASGAALVVEPDYGPAGGMGTIGREHVPQLRAAIDAVLSDPSYPRAAGAIADQMRAYPLPGELLATLTSSPCA
jgi:UDP:flavonoid glycosyltransferase YjiC (YdhE family)